MQRITKIMPLFFGVISYIWPAGLNLYFATSNLFRTGQMVLINRIDGAPGAATATTSAPSASPTDAETEDADETADSIGDYHITMESEAAAEEGDDGT